MQNTITINTDTLGADFIEGIKKMFPHKTVEITVQDADETEYILSNTKFADELRSRIKSFKKTKEVIVLQSDELI